MIIFKDIVTGDVMISYDYVLKETCEGFFYEVESKWVTKQDSEGEDERVVDIVAEFRLQEMPPPNEKEFNNVFQSWWGKVKATLPKETAEDKKYFASFERSSPPGARCVKARIKELKLKKLFLGESSDLEESLVWAYEKEGAAGLTFLFPKFALKEEKV